MLWTLSSSYWFYGTGHNPSFPAINWNAAFVIQSELEHNKLIPGFFIVINTFFSQAVHAFLLPVMYKININLTLGFYTIILVLKYIKLYKYINVLKY